MPSPACFPALEGRDPGQAREAPVPGRIVWRSQGDTGVSEGHACQRVSQLRAPVCSLDSLVQGSEAVT